MADKGRIKKLREKLWCDNPRCYWCGVLTELPNGDPRTFTPTTATIDHLRSKFQTDRTVPNAGNELRRVLACMKCNGERGAQEQREFQDTHGTTKRVKGEGDVSAWLLNFPELTTRPQLVEELKTNDRLRKRLFFAFNVMANAGNVPDVDIATHILAVLADYHWGILDDAYKAILEAKQFTIYNQLVSAYRNFRLNILNQIQRGKKGTIRRVRKPHYVERSVA